MAETVWGDEEAGSRSNDRGYIWDEDYGATMTAALVTSGPGRRQNRFFVMSTLESRAELICGTHCAYCVLIRVETID